MKQNNGGFSLVECVVSMAILGAFATAACTSLVLAHRMNGKTESMLQAQLAVSSAIEIMMAEGIDAKNAVLTESTRNTTSETPGVPSEPIKDSEGNIIIFQSGLYEEPIAVEEDGNTVLIDRFPNVKVSIERTKTDLTDYPPYFIVTVTSDNENISVTTHIREKYVSPVESEDET